MSRKFIAKGLEEYDVRDNDMEIWAEDIGDEYHTLHELYHHRLALTVALTKYIAQNSGYDYDSSYVFRSKLHADGTMFDGGYFIVGITKGEKCYISYHYHTKYWGKFNHCLTLDRAPEYDGHSGGDVIQRLMELKP